jgi:hypothetical protein
MRITLSPPNAKDEFHLIMVERLMALVDAQDLALRKSETIDDAYHEHWLIQCQDGSYHFHAPVIYINRGAIKFINGRHRTLVLSRHMQEIPMALASIDGSPPSTITTRTASMETLTAISRKKLTSSEAFDFSELPIKYLGYDDNIGK